MRRQICVNRILYLTLRKDKVSYQIIFLMETLMEMNDTFTDPDHKPQLPPRLTH